MASCAEYQAQYDAAVAADNTAEAERIAALMVENQCTDPRGSGGTGGHLPPNG